MTVLRSFYEQSSATVTLTNSWRIPEGKASGPRYMSTLIVISESKMSTESLLSSKPVLVLPFLGSDVLSSHWWVWDDGRVNQALPFALLRQTGGRRERLPPALTGPSWHFTFVSLAGGPILVALFQIIVYFPVCVLTSEDNLFIHSFIHSWNTYLLSSYSTPGIVIIIVNKNKVPALRKVMTKWTTYFYNSCFNDYKYIHKEVFMAPLAGVAQLVGHWLTNQRVTGLVPSQGTRLGWRFGYLGHVRNVTNRCFSLTSMFLALSFSLPYPLSKIKNNFF